MDSGVKLVLEVIGVLVAILVILTTYYAVRQEKQKPISGKEGLVGEIGEARTDINPTGRVLVHGEWWNARADENIPLGAKIKVIKVEKMLLRVVRATDE